MYCFLVARSILALGEAGNFPAAIKTTAEYFPKKDRAFATSIFNAGVFIGALFAPLTIPVLAKNFGWEVSFIIIGALGFVWMGFWVFLYDKPEASKHVSKEELAYIEQDKELDNEKATDNGTGKKIGFKDCLKYKKTWAFAVGKFMAPNRSLVVLPVLDPVLSEHTVRDQDQRPDGYGIDIHSLCHNDAFDLRRKASYHIHQ